MIPKGTDAISPAPHHDIYSIEDLRQLIFSLKEATRYTKPISVKVAAVHNVAAIASGMARAGADVIVVDGFRGGTGAAPARTRDNVGIPIELALASVDQRLRDEGIRSRVSLVAAGSIRNSADIVRAVALGADAVYCASSALIALGCHQCQACAGGKCNWGIATQRADLTKRLNPEIGAERVVNLVRAWNHEVQGAHGRHGHQRHRQPAWQSTYAARGVGLNEKELEILGVKYAGGAVIGMKRIYAIPEWCVNCRRCEVACKVQHSPWPGNIVKAFTLAGDEIYNRVRVEGDNIVSFAVNCRHCAKPKCVEGCISGRHATRPCNWRGHERPVALRGLPHVREHVPFGAITVVPAPSGVKPIALKCDLVRRRRGCAR